MIYETNKNQLPLLFVVSCRTTCFVQVRHKHGHFGIKLDFSCGVRVIRKAFRDVLDLMTKSGGWRGGEGREGNWRTASPSPCLRPCRGHGWPGSGHRCALFVYELSSLPGSKNCFLDKNCPQIPHVVPPLLPVTSGDSVSTIFAFLPQILLCISALGSRVWGSVSSGALTWLLGGWWRWEPVPGPGLYFWLHL